MTEFVGEVNKELDLSAIDLDHARHVHRADSCTGKRRYDDLRQAQRIRDKLAAKGVFVESYECSYCRGCHNGHAKPLRLSTERGRRVQILS